VTISSIVNGRSRPHFAPYDHCRAEFPPMPASHSPHCLSLRPNLLGGGSEGRSSSALAVPRHRDPSLRLVDRATNTPYNPPHSNANFPPKRHLVFRLYELIFCFPSEEPHPNLFRFTKIRQNNFALRKPWGKLELSEYCDLGCRKDLGTVKGWPREAKVKWGGMMTPITVASASDFHGVFGRVDGFNGIVGNRPRIANR